jgi:SAM-dependent methyltransferase
MRDDDGGPRRSPRSFRSSALPVSMSVSPDSASQAQRPDAESSPPLTDGAATDGAATDGRAARATGADHSSPNLHKYTSGGRLYHWHLRQFMHVLYDTLAQTAPQSVLDAGCGEGFVTRFLRRQNADWRLTGIDVSAEAVAYARRHADHEAGDARYCCGNLYDLPFDDDAFDTVLCSEVLEHLDHPDRAFGELHRVARRSVVVSVPREPYFQWLNDLGRALNLSPDPGHVNFWDHDGFRQFVRRHLRRPHFRTKHIYQVACGRVA